MQKLNQLKVKFMDYLIEKLKPGMAKLKEKCGDKYLHLKDEELKNLYSVFPFNKFEYILTHLIAENIFTLDQYLEIRNSYLLQNKYLHVFEITAPRTFGETWAQKHLNEFVPELKKPSKNTDPTFAGEYDFWYEGIKIEVKASRAVKRSSGDSLLNKALSINSSHDFDMNFQQIKPKCCDVFVWIGVWCDDIKYWVLSSYDIENNKFFSKGQHRGNVGEGQLWLKNSNIKEFEKFLAEPKNLLFKIKEKATPLNVINTVF